MEYFFIFEAQKEAELSGSHVWMYVWHK